MNLSEYYRSNPKRSWIFIGVAALFAGFLVVGVALDIRNHYDRVLSLHMRESESELSAVGAQIAAIKDHDFKSMDDYIAAYARVEPLTILYDRKLQRYSDLYRIAQERAQHRCVIHVGSQDTRYRPEPWQMGRE